MGFGAAARNLIAVDRERRSGGNFCGIGFAHDDRAEAAHLAVEQADGVAVAVIAAKAVRTHHFGERVALMRRGHVAAPAHFGQAHAVARFGKLPCRLRPREAAADDMNVVSHYTLSVDLYLIRRAVGAL
jgi:hypothetical protein